MPKKFIFIAIIALSLLIFAEKINRQKVFSKCVVHENYSSTHTHTLLTITQDGKKIGIPKNLGITTKCMHPLHTHDETGLIHMEYPTHFTFYLGDFFDLMGIVFSDDQVGAIKKNDGYAITLSVNGKIIKRNFRKIQLIDKDKIDLKIVSKL